MASKKVMRRRFLKGLAIVTIIVMLAACAPKIVKETVVVEKPVEKVVKETVVVEATPSKKQPTTMVWMGHQEVAGLSPADIGPTIQFVMIANIHNALVELDENLELQPVLAESYVPAEDGLSYTFKLRKSVKFHDGTELTSEDVKYTLDYYRDRDNATAIMNRLSGIDAVETPDDYTVIVRMKEPNAAFLNLGATTFIVPAHYHRQVGESIYRTAPIGTGAFKLKEWKPAEYTLLEAFDDHFRGWPRVDFIRLDIVPEGSVRAIALQTGEAHASVWPLIVEDNLRFAADPNFTVFRVPAPSTNHFPLNNQIPQFSDKRVRQAMLYAIDRQAVIDDVFKGTAVLAYANISPALAYYRNPNVKEYEYDPEKAKELLDEAGWKVGKDGIREKDGRKLSFTCKMIAGDQVRRPEAEYVQQFLKEVGIEMKIGEAPVAAILEGMREGTLEASLFNWSYGGDYGEPDGSSALASDGPNNYSQFRNDRVDELLANGLRETDPAKRREIYYEIQEIVAEEVPFLFMMHWEFFTIFSNNIRGLPVKASDSAKIFTKAYQWSISD